MGIINILVGFLTTLNYNYLIAVAVLAMIFIEDCFGLPIMGLYTVEVTNNSTLGIICVYQCLATYGFSLVVPFIVEAVSLPLLFYIFGGVTLGHFVFTCIFIKETANLSDREKKSLYAKED